MKPLARLLGTSLVLVILALAAAPPADAQQARSREANRITRVDLAEMNTTDALDAVRSLRPNWLNQRGQGSFRGGTPVRVYIDGVPRGTVEVLRSVPLHTIASMQYLGSREATQRWGTDHASGVIMVRTM
jgi:hypothetical protein